MAYKGRIRFFSLAIVLFGLLLVGRLYLVQVVRGKDFVAQADRQYFISTYDYFDRGTIYFSGKDGEEIPAATLKTGFILSVHPDEVSDDLSVVYEKLNAIVPIDRADFMAKAAKKGDPEERLGDRLTKAQADAVTALGFKGIHLAQERWRFYPGDTLASHALGFIGYDNDNTLKGRYGLERFYEETLGRNNSEASANFFVEMFSEIKRAATSDQALEGDVVTTIEPSVQAYLEDQLKGVEDTWHSDFSGGIVMDPKTGEIAAMAINPSFDPNDVKKATIGILQDKMVENVFEMGSIVKALTMAASIDAGAVTPQTTYFDAGSITLNGKTIWNYDHKGRGLINMQAVLNNSLNTGATFAMQRMGMDKFSEYMRAYGLGEETGIDLPNETHGLIGNLDSPREVEHATASFGQGIAMTPVETIRALGALANGGVLPEPHLVKAIHYRVGGTKTITPNPGKRVLKQATADTITQMLVNVVDQALANGKVKMADYSMAAKTGTAQIADNGVYLPNQYLHSFFGYFPAYNPRFIIFLFTFRPKNVDYASQTLTTPFINMVKFMINYYEIPPDRGPAVEGSAAH